ncbi:MAG: PIN domain-containing protein [Acidimicrobiales bacterium]
MRLVLDASVLVADLLRASGRARLGEERLELFIAEQTAQEVEHELPRRLAKLARDRGLDEALMLRLAADCRAAIDTNLIRVPEAAYLPLKEEARWRSARDPNDWPVVAVTLAVGGAIWTNDNDFLGTGVATWTTETVRALLARES